MLRLDVKVARKSTYVMLRKTVPIKPVLKWCSSRNTGAIELCT